MPGERVAVGEFARESAGETDSVAHARGDDDREIESSTVKAQQLGPVFLEDVDESRHLPRLTIEPRSDDVEPARAEVVVC